MVAFPVHNDSDRTVLEVTGTLYVRTEGAAFQRVTYDPQLQQLRRLGPHETGKLVFDVLAHTHVGYDVEVEFTDAAGLRWRRRGTDQPVRAVLPE